MGSVWLPTGAAVWHGSVSELEPLWRSAEERDSMSFEERQKHGAKAWTPASSIFNLNLKTLQSCLAADFQSLEDD